MKTLFAPQINSALLNRLMTRILATLLLAGTFLACSQVNNDPTPNPSTGSVTYQSMRTSFNSLEGDWLLTSYEKSPLAANLQNKATLTFKKQAGETMQMGGRSFVNLYGGVFRLDEEKGLIVSKEPIIQTLIGASQELMDAESRHLDGLTKAIAFEITQSNQLRIYLGDKANPATEVMIYTRK